MKRLRIILTTIIIACSIIGAFSVLLFALGYRPIKSPSAIFSWNESGSVAEWVGALAAIAMPIVVFILGKRLKDRNEILLSELKSFKDENEGRLKEIKDIMEGKTTLILNGGGADIDAKPNP